MNTLAAVATTTGVTMHHVNTWPEATMWIGVAWAIAFGVWAFFKYI